MKRDAPQHMADAAKAVRHVCVLLLLENIRSLFFSIIAIVLVRLIGGYVWGVGVVLSVLLTLGLVPNMVGFVSYARITANRDLEGVSAGDKLYIIIPLVARFINEAICVLGLVYLYRFFF
jgi:hypothetical protein